MATFTGTIRFNDLEGGFHELVTDDGDTYRLEGGNDVRPGQRVQVEGEVESGGFGFHMSGPSLKVKHVKALSK